MVAALVLAAALAAAGAAASPPRGHLEPLGAHRAPGAVDVVPVADMTPLRFSQYVREARPVLVRGAHSSPAVGVWTFDTVAEKYGDMVVQLEPRDEMAPEMGDDAFDEYGEDHVPLRQFVEEAHEVAYVVSMLPDPMMADLERPPFLACPPLNDSLIEVNFWMSAGGTRSTLHKDSSNLLSCQVAGSKEWVLIDHAEARKLPLAQEGAGDAYTNSAGFSLLDPQSVDLIAYPDVAGVRWANATVRPGDCLYVPGSHLHQVNSSPSTNIAYSLILSGPTQLHRAVELGDPPAGCGAAAEPLGSADVAYRYPGLDPRTSKMGWQDPDIIRDNLASEASRGVAVPDGAVSREQWLAGVARVVDDTMAGGADDQHADAVFDPAEVRAACLADANAVFDKLEAAAADGRGVTAGQLARMPRRLVYHNMAGLVGLRYMHSLYDDAGFDEFRKEFAGKREERDL